MSSNPSKTPWRAICHHFIDDADGNAIACIIDNPDVRDLIVSSVNFYESLPEDVRRLRPETVVLAIEHARDTSTSPETFHPESEDTP